MSLVQARATEPVASRRDTLEPLPLEEMPTGADVRAERLRIGLALFEGYPYIEPRESPVALSPAEVRLAEDDVDELDRALLNECLEVERELRDSGYAALERLSATVAGRQGKLNERVRALPPSEIGQACSDLYDAGMVYAVPTEDCS
jgi:hypothetical protein